MSGGRTWHSIRLQPGDRVYLYSDGITEAMNGDRAPLGVERLQKIIEQNRDKALQEGIKAILHQVDAWTGDADARDDISILAVELPPIA